MKVVIMAGGTGGHIFPGLAVAQELLNMNVEVVWLGAVGGMEEQLVAQHNIPIKLLAIKGLRGKGIKGLITMPIKLLMATKAALKYFKQEKVGAIISMGGYVAAPGGLAARLKRLPLLVHEQNSKFGMTNKYLAKWAQHVLTGFNLNGLYHSQWVGNPVRAEIENLEKIDRQTNRVNVFIMGGSLGANSLNNIIPKCLLPLLAEDKVSIKHQCGKNNKTSTAQNYQNNSHVEVLEFIKDMSSVYAWADIIIARAGALSIAEINAVGLPAILVPYPYAVDDHQTSNANNIVAHKAGYIWQEKEDVAQLKTYINDLIDNQTLRQQMSVKSKALHHSNSARKVAEICLEMIA
ncbi:MAG TPA: undecaprenyldiphospho-muramoylpentapeptide beta-N-acetylglucosaminyltransferase [Oceanospirillales bacterium]|nr:undecaprenyldiphospho-muramoylpentapeptide beta-N-acetylglucosaminyltransferase [Oceanospirillales bacterium]